ncbi:MAG: alpha-galactosidase [Lewinellaceae bacterium]|nr:alpha-galactosidase [Lewinellaceae bacterium]
MQLRQAIFEYNDEKVVLQPGRAASFEAVFVDFQQEALAGGTRYTLFIHPKANLVLHKLELHFNLPLPPEARMLCNGWQSWSESRMLPVGQPYPILRKLAKNRLGRSGDNYLPGFPLPKNASHSWTYTQIVADNRCWLAGSLNENTGFTCWEYANGRLIACKDLAGLQLGHSFPALDIWVGEGIEKDLYDQYTALLEHKPARIVSGLGWTSWYRHYSRISEQVLRKDLEAVVASGLPFQWFQIDDGWQQSVGDWLPDKVKFPAGMGKMAADIRSKGLQPGLWLAPFVAAGTSEVVRQHPDWLLKESSGKPLRAGWNPGWGGWYYALDFYHPGVQEHLSGVFHRALDHWGYALLKLDFLFAACIQPPPGKNRGQVMHEAMLFLRHQMGDKIMLACGVPLGAAFGIADICRIGGDVHLHWEHRLLAALRFRERVSTLAALRATLNRWQLAGRVFASDPDVFMLRQEGQHLSLVQQQTLLMVNALLGDVLFTSDDPSGWSPEQQNRITGSPGIPAGGSTQRTGTPNRCVPSRLLAGRIALQSAG